MSGGGGDNRVEETPEQREAAKIAKEKFELYRDKFVEVENWYQSQVANMNTGAEYLRAAGVGNVEGQVALGQGLRTAGRVDPNSSKFTAVTNAVETQGGSVLGRNAGRGIVGQQNRYMGGMGNIASIGMGEGSKAQAGFNMLAKNAEQQARFDVEDRYNQRMEKLNLVGQLAGVGGSVYADVKTPKTQPLMYPAQPYGQGLNYSPVYPSNPTSTNWDAMKS